jgi:hypothetical protein
MWHWVNAGILHASIIAAAVVQTADACSSKF